MSRDMKAQDQPVAGVRIMAAMEALSALKQVWEAQGSSAAAGAELMREAQKHTAVRVIDHEGDCKGWGTSDLFQMLRTTGFMNVAMSDNPCSLDYPEHPATGTRYNPMPELTHLLARAFRDQANRDATGTAIIVSHYRALSEAAHSINQQGLIVVFERDFQPGINCFYQLQFVFREFFKLPKEERPHYFSLCSSVDRLDHTGPIVKLALDSPARVRGRGWYWLPHPWQDKPGGHVALQHLGQGARAYAVEALFVRWLLENQQVWCWWDVYLSGEACNYAMRRRNGNRNTTILVFPTLGSHPVVLSDATRGSDRLRSMLPNAAAKLAPFITLELKAGCGFSNRLNTMAITMTACHHAGLGLHILWEKSDACPSLLEAVVPTVDSYPQTLPGLSFLQVHSECATHFRAAQSSSMQGNLGNFSFQSTPALFGPALLEVIRETEPRINPLSSDDSTISFAPAYRALMPSSFVQEGVSRYMGQWPSQTMHVCFHIRRGDAMARDLQHARQSRARMKVEEVQQCYDDADQAIEAHRVLKPYIQKRACPVRIDAIPCSTAFIRISHATCVHTHTVS